MHRIKIVLIALVVLFMIDACNNTSESEKNTTAETEVNKTQLPDGHTSQNSLDWSGTYKGVLPCADCEGIETTLVLNDDLTFEKTSVYQGKKGSTFNEKGQFSWDKAGRVITLEMKDGKQSYRVKEGSLVMLDNEGKENTGKLADLYILKKQ